MSIRWKRSTPFANRVRLSRLMHRISRSITAAKDFTGILHFSRLQLYQSGFVAGESAGSAKSAALLAQEIKIFCRSATFAFGLRALPTSCSYCRQRSSVSSPQTLSLLGLINAASSRTGSSRRCRQPALTPKLPSAIPDIAFLFRRRFWDFSDDDTSSTERAHGRSLPPPPASRCAIVDRHHRARHC